MKNVKTGIVLAAALLVTVLGFMSCGSSGKAKLIRIRVSPAAPVVVTGIQLDAVGEFSDGKILTYTSEVVWSSSSPSVATVGTTAGHIGRVTVLSLGTTTITAEEPFNHFTSSAVLTVVKPDSITITPENPVMRIRDFHDFVAIATFGTLTQSLNTSISSTAPALDSSLTLTWSTSNPEIATVSKHGLVTASTKTTGLVDIIASFTIDPNIYSAVSGTTPLRVVSGRLLKIEITPLVSSLSLSSGPTTTQLTATGSYDDTTTLDLTTSVEWVSLLASFHTGTVPAVVSNVTGSKGFVTAQSPGTSHIKATDPISHLTGSATVSVIP
jgi:hypothetical protein